MEQTTIIEKWDAQAGADLRAHCRRKAEEYAKSFQNMDDEFISGEIDNRHAGDWMISHIPLADLPDHAIELTYYFRWWTYRKHIRKTDCGHILTEFLPDVPWAGRYNSISAAASHHIAEGRWLRDFPGLDETLRYWYTQSENLNDYTHWMEYMACLLYIQRGYLPDDDVLKGMLQWFNRRLESNWHSSGLFWSEDSKEATEFSVGGNGLRIPISCYLAANAAGLAWMLQKKGKTKEAERYFSLSVELTERINRQLWDPELGFYVGLHLPRREDSLLKAPDPRFHARELWGYLPWYFRFAPFGREATFTQLLDPDGFYSPWGLTTVEQRHPGFGCFMTGDELNKWLEGRGEEKVDMKGHECLWNGPSWPFATSQALTALRNLLRYYPSCGIDKDTFYHLLKIYSESHRRYLPNGKRIPWIDENLNPYTGEWIARERLMKWSMDGWAAEKGGYERGKDYNHSTFCDLVISGLFGFGFDETDVFLMPLIPSVWEYACLLDVPCHGQIYHVIWDRTGTRYHMGKGLHLFKE